MGNTRLLVVDGPVRPPTPREVAAESAPAPAQPAPAPEGPRPPWLAASAADPEPPIFDLPTVPEPAPLPQAPRLADRIAPYRMRGLAFLIDSVIAGGIAPGTYLALGRSLFTALLAIALILCWDFLFESLRSQTIGKRIMKYRVVRRDGSLLRPQHVAVRSVLRLIDNVLFATLSIVLSGQSRRQWLGDLAAGTIVVKSERMMSRLPSSDGTASCSAPIRSSGSHRWWPSRCSCRARAWRAARTTSCRTTHRRRAASALPACRMAALAVNPGHTLRWNGADVQLLATRAQASTAVPGSEMLVAFELSVRNPTAQPVRFDVEAVRLIVNIPDGGGRVGSGRELDPWRCTCARRPPDRAADQDRRGRHAGGLGALRSAGELRRPAWHPHGQHHLLPADAGPGLPRVGNIRLWHPANPRSPPPRAWPSGIRRPRRAA